MNDFSHFAPIFLDRIDQTPGHGPNDDCWLWTAGTKNGYGFYSEKYAHRLAYEMHNGVAPGDGYVRHRCHIRLCVNPHHLRLGTPDDNVQDSVEAGLHAHGERMGSAKTTGRAVEAARWRYVRGLATVADCARDLGLCVYAAWTAVTGRTWKHVAMPPAALMESRRPLYRSPSGLDAPWSVFSEEQVIELRRQYWYDRRPAHEIAAELGVGMSTAYEAAIGKTYEDVPMPPDDVQQKRERRTERGDLHPATRITDDDVIQMRVQRKAGVPVKALAAQYSTCESNVRTICRGDTRKHVRMP